MKNFIVLLIFISINMTISPEYVAADNTTVTGAENGNVESPIVLTPVRRDKDRPKMPSRQFITCYYDGESLNMDFAYSEGECEVCVTDVTTNFSRFYYIDSSELLSTIYVGEINSSIITVTTSHGHIYTGELYLE